MLAGRVGKETRLQRTTKKINFLILSFSISEPTLCLQMKTERTPRGTVIASLRFEK
jgi:hypothetical protein